MATAAKITKQIADPVVDGAKRVVSTESLAVVGGLASSRVIEASVYGMFRGVFGFQDGSSEPTQEQQTARIAAKVAVAVLAGGLLVGSRDKHLRGAGIGLMAGATWHTLNDFGVNV